MIITNTMRATLLRFAAAGLFAMLTNAQTFTDCNPMLKTCPPDPALSGVYQHTYGGEAPNFKYLSSKDSIKYGGKDGAVFRIAKPKDAPTIVSNFYIMWGRFEVVLKASPGAGVISSIVLQSDDLDEVDWEWLGGKPGEAQSNYFGKGNTATYDRGAVHSIDSQARFHKYGIDWTAEKIDWLIDDVVVRTLKPSQVKGDFYPQTPMTAKIGSWAGGDPDNEQGVIEWAGGPTDFTKGPFDMVVQSIYVRDYSTGKEYVYADKSGSSASIKSNGGSIMGGGTNPGTPNLSSSSSVAPSSGSSGSTSSFNSPSNSGRISSTSSKSHPKITLAIVAAIPLTIWFF
ncbi:Glycoside Hydrolase Family 16 protein [Tuber magnatum]|uniref:chitinase n=1 Tax=Tuber magnatum TaxID=42249 RepID=A0A317SL42_9PEZI|nr:Glycoside Hydrolase Family 16 protein [Tuber magnatum]